MTADTPDGAVRTYYQLVDAGRTEELVALFDDDCTYDRPGYPQIRGKRALEDFYRTVRVIADGEHALADVIKDGNRVVAVGRFDGHLHDRTAVSVGFCDYFVMAPSGTILARRTYFEAPSI